MAIKIENVDVYGFEAAIRGLRNPYNSWDKSDSLHCCDEESNCGDCGWYIRCPQGNPLVVGKNDMELMTTLANAGTDHGKFLRMITVTLDITAPLYWWKEFDTYKVGTVANSCSTMHKIADKEFTADDFSHEHLNDECMDYLDAAVLCLNRYRELFQKDKNKAWWWQMIQLLPSSYNQRRTVMLNYAVLKNIYNARRNHKLDEWNLFCDWAESLPYSELITGKAVE